MAKTTKLQPGQFAIRRGTSISSRDFKIRFSGNAKKVRMKIEVQLKPDQFNNTSDAVPIEFEDDCAVFSVATDVTNTHKLPTVLFSPDGNRIAIESIIPTTGDKGNHPS